MTLVPPLQVHSQRLPDQSGLIVARLPAFYEMLSFDFHVVGYLSAELLVSAAVKISQLRALHISCSVADQV